MPCLRFALRVFLTLIACGVLSACGDGENGTEELPSSVIEVATPVPPVTVPEVDSPPPAPSQPEAVLNPELHARFTRGLNLADARSLTPIEAIRVGGDSQSTEIYRWTDDHGTSFTARFDDGVLTTKSSLVTQQAPGATPIAPAEVDIDNMPVAQIAPGVYIPLERAITATTDQPLGTSELPESPEPQESRPVAPSAPRLPSGPTIAIAGDLRREGDATTRTSSYHPKASLPDFFRSIDEGSFEIRFLNPSDSPMAVGVRQDKLGKNLEVPPKGKASLKVNRGTYQVFFLREDEPDTLFEAPPITIDGFQATDVEVHLDPENVEVRLIDYSKTD